MFSKKRAMSVPTLFDLKRIQNLEYHNALSVIKQQVEPNLIRLTKTELPFEVAFRVPENEYLGISMGRDNLHGTPIHMSYVDNLFKIPPCITQTELSCFLHHLYPQWYASNRNTAFIYIDPHLNETHYRQMPIASFGDLHFLRLTMPVNALKSSLKFIGSSIPKTWNEVMVTPPNILESLRAITHENALSLFIDEIFHQDNLTPIDAVFIQALNELCVRLNVKCKTYYKIATKISICGEFYTESKFHSTRWYIKVFNILQSTGGVIGNIIDVNAFFIAVAHVDIITPLSLQYMFLRFVDAASPMEQPSALLMQQLKQLCSKENLKQSEIADIVERLHATDDSDKKKSRIDSLMQLWSSYNVLVEVKTNEHNFGIMNTALTRALIQFFQQWYLKEVSVSSEGVTTMFHALVNNINYVDIDQSEDALNQIKFMQSSYGNVFRHSSKEPDFEFALCLNILLNHLYSGSNAGYYMGQVMCKDIHGSGMLTTMNAELTIPQGLNYDPKINYTVRTVRKIDNGYETGPDSEGGRRRKKTINIKQRRKRGNKTKRIIQQKKIKSHRKI
jgi:hypothetical protein